MVKDHEWLKANGKSITEILVGGMWIPVCATDLRILNNDLDLVRVTEIRVRRFKKGE